VTPVPFFRPTPTGVLVTVRVTPRAAADRIDGVEERDDGTAVLRIRVHAVPDKGRANAAVAALLAAALKVPKSAVAVASGATAREKTLRITGDPAALMPALALLAPDP
jgi:uncharacterized protein (TIGR00251 family)